MKFYAEMTDPEIAQHHAFELEGSTIADAIRQCEAFAVGARTADKRYKFIVTNIATAKKRGVEYRRMGE